MTATIRNYALSFDGQSTPWHATLKDVLGDPAASRDLHRLVTRADDLLAAIGPELAALGSGHYELEELPNDSSPVHSVPGITAAQTGLFFVLLGSGFDIVSHPPIDFIGHSQGILGAALVERWVAGEEEQAAQIFALARLIGAATTKHRPGVSNINMLSVRHVDRPVIKRVIRGTNVSIALVNGFRRFVLSGCPDQLEAVKTRLEELAAAKEKQEKQTGACGETIKPVMEYLEVSAPFHDSLLQPALDQVDRWRAQTGLPENIAHYNVHELAAHVLVKPLNWQKTVLSAIGKGADTIVCLGPGDVIATVTANACRGRGVAVVPAGSVDKIDDLASPGYTPAESTDYSAYAPKLITLPGDPMPKVDTKFSRLTGLSPIMLAGMTPTTVDPEIVAAAANAGYWAELAGGGQVTAEVLHCNVEKLKKLLQPGRTAQFNAMFMDRYLWNLHFGSKHLVASARRSGAPIDGVVITAGIPEVDEAEALFGELRTAGFSYVSVKPGTVAQIRQCLAIAKYTDHLILQVEDGRAGGHHSWESLDELLIATYYWIRKTSGVVLTVGGGLGDPKLAAMYLTGTWSEKYGLPPMPVDAVFIGTPAMTAKEAKTTDAVKQLLVDTPGTKIEENCGWVPRGEVRGGMTSGMSHLHADMHEVDNAAAACARIIASVHGDTAKIEAHRDELIEAMNKTARPYFGDLSTMSYADVIRRYVELDYPYVDPSWQWRLHDLLQRFEARLAPEEHGDIATLFPSTDDVADAPAAVEIFLAHYPQAEETTLTAIDEAWFIHLSRKYPKPTGYVPALDEDLLRWWGQDCLWQSQDERYSADSVRVIPGPVSVGFVTTKDEPVAEILARFENAAAHTIAVSGAKPSERVARIAAVEPAAERRATPPATRLRVEPLTVSEDIQEPVHADIEQTDGIADTTAHHGRHALTASTAGEPCVSTHEAIKASPVISWMGALMTNPMRVLDPEGYELHHEGGNSWTIAITMDTAWDNTEVTTHAVRHLDIPLIVDASIHTGGCPVVDPARLSTTMFDLLAGIAGVGGVSAQGDTITELPRIVESRRSRFGEAHYEFTCSRSIGITHGSTTGAALGEDQQPIVIDALLGPCWPAIYAALGSGRVGDMPVIEGLLQAVHLDHSALVRVPLNELEGTSVAVTSWADSIEESRSGRIVTVKLELSTANTDGAHTVEPAIEFTERFAIRGRAFGTEAPKEPAAAGGVEAEVTDTPRSHIGSFTVTAPREMTPFAWASGDFNPIHTSHRAARVAGLTAPLVHGMWLSATAQHAAEAALGDTLVGWTYRMFSMVALGDEVEISVDRVGRVTGGGLSVEVTCTIGGTLVSQATAVTAAPRTAYVYPGQGIQSQGMGMKERTQSRAATEVWDKADKVTRERLGFSVLSIVRDNPTEVVAGGVTYRHPKGVLNLTQFTQVCLATLALAQTAQLKEAGVYVPGAYFAGHSLGEYTALAAYAGIIDPATVLELVFQRGLTMHHLVPRDEEGNSNYLLGALRPNQFGVGDADVADYVASVSQESGEMLEIVNYNLRDQQYAIAGTVAGIAALEKDSARRAEQAGGKRPFMLVPGIDVPFHSRVLRNGVDDFRRKLDELLPHDIDPEILLGHYIPNLVARPFDITEEFRRAILDVAPSQIVKELDLTGDRSEVVRSLLVELLAWQFASPVRWIETQEFLLGRTAQLDEYVELGLGSAPTLTNLAAKTLKLPGFDSAHVTLRNVQRDAQFIFHTDVAERPVAEEPTVTDTGAVADGSVAADTLSDAKTHNVAAGNEPGTGNTPAVQVTSTPAAADAPAPAAGTPVAAGGSTAAPLPFTAGHAIRALLAQANKMRLDQVGDADTIGTLTSGVSSRLNQQLMDMSAELSLPAVEGASEADIRTLTGTVNAAAKNYQPFGEVLTKFVKDQVRSVFGPAGAKLADIATRVNEAWALPAGWDAHVTVALALGTRSGTSARGGELATLPGSVTSVNEVNYLIDAAIQQVAADNGVTVAPPAQAATGGAVVDSGALNELAEQILGKKGILAESATHLLEALGHGANNAQGADDAASAAELAELTSTVVAEAGSDWARKVMPSFDEDKIVLFDDRWSSAREDIARLAVGETIAPTASFTGTGEDVAAIAEWHGLTEIADSARATDDGEFVGQVAVVTGVSPHSIASGVAAELLSRGATVIATSSRVTLERTEWARNLYRDHASGAASLWLTPANLASYRDIDSLAEWIGSDRFVTVGSTKKKVKDGWMPDLLFPFAAPPVRGYLTDAGINSEFESRVLLWGVEKLVGKLSAIGETTDINHRLHIVLPGSPNRGTFGGDGSYGEVKAAFDAIVNKWSVEPFGKRTTIAHPRIGWVKSTNLMGHNDRLVSVAESHGVHVWTPATIATDLVALCSQDNRTRATEAPLEVDLTGGLAAVSLPDIAAEAAANENSEESLGTEATTDADRKDGSDRDTTVQTVTEHTIPALPTPHRRHQPTHRDVRWTGSVTTPVEDMVVVVGLGEISPWGSWRTRFEAEYGIDHLGAVELTPAGVTELAWMMGLISWEDNPAPGWYDTAGAFVAESDIYSRYHDEVVARCGVRPFNDDGPIEDGSSGKEIQFFLEHDVTFAVDDLDTARSYVEADPQFTRLRVADDGTISVTRLAGATSRVPKKATLARAVGGQIPDGFDPQKWGIPTNLTESIDRIAVWNLVATVDAFLSSGFDPAELLQAVHPADVATTQGTGFGGMSSMRKLFLDRFLDHDIPSDILQETLPNVVAAHTMQTYVGGYGSMIHPIGACATAAVSVEEGVDKIALGKADFVVAGGIDDISVESIQGFAMMNATANSQEMADKGIDPRFFSRANDRRRGGFVESAGGGTVLLARGSVARDLGLPVLAVVAFAQSNGDGAHTSIPAPGLGALATARGGKDSRLARSLAGLGVTADDIAVISKHDTSTNANDPNETRLHTFIAEALGRSAGNPQYVISQKTLTGHAKGGAAVFQIGGLADVFATGRIPGNASLTCVDPEMKDGRWFTWLTKPLQLEEAPKAALLTSLGFGHVSGLVALVHPAAFATAVEDTDWAQRAQARLGRGDRRIARGMLGKQTLFTGVDNRRFREGDAIQEKEKQMLLDPQARLTPAGWF
ncbi:MAG: fatty acid synthase subunit beta domain-containing protein [Corynebacterium pyruviciproducens]|uniref:fatty acid synthase subunit beta domain-containing protein n=1 Tax=Corynebacterium pyruviciproducens TaxID=598660 RepID=UPI0039832DF7